MAAASLSFRDVMILRGDYVLPVKDDVVPLAEGSGTIAALGSGVHSIDVGARVVASVFPDWHDGSFEFARASQLGGTLDGTLAEYIVCRADAVVPIPRGISLTHAATIPCSALAAWNALTGAQRVLPGETVLTLGSGGVSLFAIQLASMLGARVIATTGDRSKADRLVALGADEVVDYRLDADWPTTVRDMTNGAGVDHIVEVAGTLARSLECAALGAQVSLVGLVSQVRSPVDPEQIFLTGATIRPMAIGSTAQLAGLLKAMDSGAVEPVVSAIYPFDDAPEAYAHYVSGSQQGTLFGKVVISMDGAPQ